MDVDITLTLNGPFDALGDFPDFSIAPGGIPSVGATICFASRGDAGGGVEVSARVTEVDIRYELLDGVLVMSSATVEAEVLWAKHFA